MAKQAAYSEVVSESNSLLYKIYPQRWFQSFPFYFVIKYPDYTSSYLSDQSLAEVARFYLPCPPQSLTVQDMSTSDAYATFGGVVEETSAPVFTNVILTGTTGLALNDQSGTGVASMVRQRKLFSEATGGTNVLSRLGQAAVGAVTGAIQGLTGNAEPALPFANYGSAVPTPDNDDPVRSFFSGRGMDVSSAIAKMGAFLPGLGSETRAQAFSNGFSWSIALRQFFLKYATTKAKYPDVQLYFIDEKRNTQSRCVVRSPQFQNVAGQPMIQSYTIYLKCWDTKDVEGKSFGPVDRLETDLKNVETLNAASAILSAAKTIRRLRRPLDLAGSLVSSTVGSKLSG
jgi:hypothetical protein